MVTGNEHRDISGRRFSCEEQEPVRCHSTGTGREVSIDDGKTGHDIKQLFAGITKQH